MLSPRSFRGDHWTLSSDMLKYELEDEIELCGDCPHCAALYNI